MHKQWLPGLSLEGEGLRDETILDNDAGRDVLSPFGIKHPGSHVSHSFVVNPCVALPTTVII